MERIKLTSKDLQKMMQQSCNSIAKSKEFYYPGKNNSEYEKLLDNNGVRKLKTLAWKIRKSNTSIDTITSSGGCAIIFIEYKSGQGGWYNYSVVDYKEIDNAKVDGFNVFPFLITSENDVVILDNILKTVVTSDNVNNAIYRVDSIEDIEDIISIIDIVSIILGIDNLKTYDIIEKYCVESKLNSIKDKLSSSGFTTVKSKDVKKIVYKSGDTVGLNVRCPDCNGELKYTENVGSRDRKVLSCSKCLTEARVEKGDDNYVIRSSFANKATREKRVYVHDIIDNLLIINHILEKDTVYGWMHDELYDSSVKITDVHIGNMNEPDLNKLVERIILLIKDNKDKVTIMPDLIDKSYEWIDFIIYNKSIYPGSPKYKNILKTYVDSNKTDTINEETKEEKEEKEEIETIKDEKKNEVGEITFEYLIRQMVKAEINKALKETPLQINEKLIEEMEELKSTVDELNKNIVLIKSQVCSLGEKDTFNLTQYNKAMKNISSLQDSVKNYSNKVVEVEKEVKGMYNSKEFAKKVMSNLTK